MKKKKPRRDAPWSPPYSQSSQRSDEMAARLTDAAAIVGLRHGTHHTTTGAIEDN